MWGDYIEYFKDPRLVAEIQEFFGVKIHRNGSNDAQRNSTKIKKSPKRLKDSHKSKNGYSTSDDEGSREPPKFTVTNKFWYYLFLFGTELGDEIFYATFIPFWFWNIDGAVGRRIVLVWAVVMTIGMKTSPQQSINKLNTESTKTFVTGQCLKDILRWPRPACPPAARLQSKWSQEYGMPSTHAMIGVSIPFSVVLFTMNRYVYSFNVGITVAILWY